MTINFLLYYSCKWTLRNVSVNNSEKDILAKGCGPCLGPVVSENFFDRLGLTFVPGRFLVPSHLPLMTFTRARSATARTVPCATARHMSTWSSSAIRGSTSPLTVANGASVDKENGDRKPIYSLVFPIMRFLLRKDSGLVFHHHVEMR